MRFVNVVAASLLIAGTAAQADTVNWASWTSQPDANTVVGNIGAVGVTYSGPVNFSQLNNTGTDYWVDLGYTQGVVNRPTGTDLVSLSAGGTKTITFSTAVSNVYMAFTSWNGNTATFSSPFSVVSQGCGYWGCGTFVVNGASDGFFGNGEVHGVLKFAGPITSLTFTDTDENWHGFTVGLGAVPDASTWAMLIAGFGLVGAMARRRRTVVAA